MLYGLGSFLIRIGENIRTRTLCSIGGTQGQNTLCSTGRTGQTWNKTMEGSNQTPSGRLADAGLGFKLWREQETAALPPGTRDRSRRRPLRRTGMELAPKGGSTSWRAPRFLYDAAPASARFERRASRAARSSVRHKCCALSFGLQL